MDRIIVLGVSIAFLLTSFTLAVGAGFHTANLDRIWKKEEACRQSMDRRFNKIQKEAERDVSEMCNTPVRWKGDKGPK
jgi:hypothetical protein